MHRITKKFSFRCFEVDVSVETNETRLLERIKRDMPHILPVKWIEIRSDNIEHRFQIIKNFKTGKFSVTKGEEIVCDNSEKGRALDLLISRVRLTIAEFADQMVFLHAGVVSWQNKTIILPGKSFAGKTTLVAEFAKNGCEYFSDEYALIDSRGMVHPFPKKLSMRGIIDDYTQIDLDVEKIGGRRAQKPLKVGWILVAEYKKNKSKAKLKPLSLGEGVMASIANSISVRQNPKFVIEVLNKALQQSIALKTERGEAAEFVKVFFDYVKKNYKNSFESNDS